MGEMQKPRQLYIMRHAERLDFALGKFWISTCFDKEGKYIRSNLNMPMSLPKRSGGPMDFTQDCPLTRIGLLQATFAGEAMKSSNVTFSHVFCSPALRCMETCRSVQKASDQTHLPINVEPGLFEWTSWHPDGMPTWMSSDEFKEHGFNASEDYIPVMNESEILNRKETSEEYYERNFAVTSNILRNYSGNILFVAHASSLDTCSRHLVGKEPRDEVGIMKIVRNVSYAAVAVVEQSSGPLWKLVEPPFSPLTHLKNEGFQWKTLLD